MRAYTLTTRVDRDARTVWNYLTDLSHAPRWRAGIKSMEVDGGGPVRADSIIRVVVEAYGKVADRTMTVTVFDAPSRWTTESAAPGSGLEGTFTYTLEPDGNGTRVTTTCDLRATKFLSWLFLPLIARGERMHRQDQMGAFKAACEQATAP